MSERKEKLIRRQARRIAELESQVRFLTAAGYRPKPARKPGLWQRIKAFLTGK